MYVYIYIYYIKFIFKLGIFGIYSLCAGAFLQDIMASQNMFSLCKYLWLLILKWIGKQRTGQMHGFTEDLLWNRLSTMTWRRAIGRWKIGVEQLHCIYFYLNTTGQCDCWHVLHWRFKCCLLILTPKLQSNDYTVQKTAVI